MALVMTFGTTPAVAAMPTSRHAVATAIGVSIALIYSTYSGMLLRAPLDALNLPPVPYLRSALTSLGDAIALIAIVALAAWRSPLQVMGVSGLAAPIGRPALWALLWLVPALLACLLLTRPATNADGITWLGFGGPVVEEFVYRGLAIGVLVRFCGWHWLPACLLPAVFFGLGHWGQGDDPASIAGIVALTGFGGLLFGWLFVRWRFNLWPSMFLHIGLNTLWLVFDLGENALGGWLGNVMRIGVLLIAIAATFWLAPPKVRPAAGRAICRKHLPGAAGI